MLLYVDFITTTLIFNTFCLLSNIHSKVLNYNLMSQHV